MEKTYRLKTVLWYVTALLLLLLLHQIPWNLLEIRYPACCWSGLTQALLEKLSEICMCFHATVSKATEGKTGTKKPPQKQRTVVSGLQSLHHLCDFLLDVHQYDSFFWTGEPRTRSRTPDIFHQWWAEKNHPSWPVGKNSSWGSPRNCSPYLMKGCIAGVYSILCPVQDVFLPIYLWSGQPPACLWT